MLLTALVVLIGIASALYVYSKWNLSYWRRRGVAGPEPRIYTGTFPKTTLMDSRSNYIDETTEIYNKYFRKHRFIGVYEYHHPKLMILDPQLASDIYVKYFKHFEVNTIGGERINGRLDPLFKRNPFVVANAQWKEIRNEVAPMFTALKVKVIYPIIENACHQLEQYIDSKIDSGQTIFNTKDICSRVIADIVFNFVFGLDAKVFETNSESLEHACSMLYCAPHQAIRSFMYAQFPWVRKMLPEPFTNPEFTVWFKSLLDHAIQMRRSANIKRDDYLNFLIELRDKKNTPMEMIYSHAYTYFLDGFETTSHTLGNAINNLAESRECQQRLRTEVNNYVQPITFDDLHQMTYLDAVVNETVRISPFPFALWKTCTQDIQLTDFDGKSHHIEKGVEIILPINSYHCHPDFYEHPEKFDPQRFVDNSGNLKTLKEAGVFIPFGNGPRQCLGMRHAVADVKAALCTLVRKYEFSMESPPSKPSQALGRLFFLMDSAVLNIKRVQQSD